MTIEHVTPAGRSVFYDLYEPEKAANLQVRAQLMIELTKVLKEQFSTQAEAAKALDVTQSRISDLYRGKIGKFTVDILINMLITVGRDIEITTKAAAWIDMPKKIEFAETIETDNRPREIQLLINLIQPDPEYQPLFLSDEACFLDITSESRETIEAKLRAYFRGDLPAPVTTPLWQFIEIVKQRYPGWPDEIHH